MLIERKLPTGANSRTAPTPGAVWKSALFGSWRLLVLLAAACLAPMDPSKVPIASVKVSIGDTGAGKDTLQVRATGRVEASAIATEGYDVGLTNFRYTSSNPAVAVVDSLGTVRGVSVGTATITATLPGGQSGSAPVTIVPSTIAYRISLNGVPGAIAFSTDYSKAYVVTGSDSLTIIDALGFFRIGTVDVGQRIGSTAATGTLVYASNPDVDSVSVISAATKSLVGRIWVGAGPDGMASYEGKAYVAASYDQKVVILDGTTVTLGIPMGGQPHQLAIGGSGTRLFATVKRANGWYLVVADPTYPDTLSSVALPGPATAVAAARDGSAAYVLVPSLNEVVTASVSSDGKLSLGPTVSVPSSASGVAVRSFGLPYLVVSGSPLTIYDGSTLAQSESIPTGGDGAVALRPDGLFVFVGSKSTGEIHVIGL